MRDEGLISKKQLQIVEILSQQQEPRTANEVFNILSNKYGGLRFDSNTRARFTELREKGVIAEDGLKVCPITGRKCIAWVYTGNLPADDTRPKKLSRKHLERCREILIKVWQTPDLPINIRDMIAQEFE